MFVTFIAIIVILIVIVSIMNTGVTSSSGGTDQTKAVKAITEVSTLAQNSGFYKSLSDNNDYAGLTTQALVDNGIVDAGDTVSITAGTNDTEYEDEAGNHPADGARLIKSKAISGLYYEVSEGPDANHLQVKVWKKTADAPAAGDSLAIAIDRAYSKFGAYDPANGSNEGVSSNTAANDGLATVVFR